jgi:geranylgeranyl reductase family protein
MLSVDVAIVGSGPAGASAAYFLAKSGIKVAVLEKETLPRYKTCGGGLVFRGRNLLPFDVSGAIATEFKHIDVYFSGENIHLQVKRDFPIVSMVMRDSFDSLIIEKAKTEGAKIFDNEKLKSIEDVEGKKIITTSKNTYAAKFVIGADGVLGSVAKLSGWKEDSRYLIPALEVETEVVPEKFEQLRNETRFDIDMIPKGYAWSFPKKQHLSLGVASVKRGKIDLRHYYREYLKTLNIQQSDIVDEKTHGFQIPVKSRKGKLAQNATILVGDAAGFADPLTAEGISNAIYSGRLAAEALVEGNLVVGDVEKLYEQKIKEKLLPELKSAKYLASIFYNQRRIRNYFIKRDGKRFAEYLTDIFTGKRHYPADFVEVAKKRFENLV